MGVGPAVAGRRSPPPPWSALELADPLQHLEAEQLALGGVRERPVQPAGVVSGARSSVRRLADQSGEQQQVVGVRSSVPVGDVLALRRGRVGSFASSGPGQPGGSGPSDDAVGTQAGDLLLGEAQLAQDLVGVRPKTWGEPAHLGDA